MKGGDKGGGGKRGRERERQILGNNNNDNGYSSAASDGSLSRFWLVTESFTARRHLLVTHTQKKGGRMSGRTEREGKRVGKRGRKHRQRKQHINTE